MENTEKDVKKDGASSANVTVDEKGVPWENRAKEYERKFQELNTKYETLAARAVAEDDAENAPSEDQLAEEKKRKIAEFVEDPDGFIARKFAEREMQREVPAAESWLRGQQGFAKEDETRIAEIIREHQLQQPSPMLRAKAAWSILKAEKLEREFSESQRESSVNRSRLEGNGKAAPNKNGPNRADLISQLRDAERKGDRSQSARILGLLEDVRE